MLAISNIHNPQLIAFETPGRSNNGQGSHEPPQSGIVTIPLVQSSSLLQIPSKQVLFNDLQGLQGRH
jgi:hypothetical protein